MYDVIIIGTGVAGYSAAIYAARFNLKTLLVGKRFGGLLQDTHIVENYPGYKSISGFDLMQKMLDHVKSYDIDIVESEVTAIKKNDQFEVTTKDKSYEGKTIILATGTKARELNIPGEKEFKNKGVSYCALCDAPLFKDKVVGVIGGSDSAAKEALLLAEYAKKVYIIYRKEKIRAEPVNLERVKKNDKIEVINNTNVIEVKGDNMMDQVVLDNEFNGSKELELQGLFIEIGHIPQTELAKKLGVTLNEKGEVITDEDSKTSVEGVCAAGDLTNKDWKQAIIGAAEGVTAAWSIYNYLKN